MVPERSTAWLNTHREEPDRQTYTLDLLRNPQYKMRLLEWNGRSVYCYNEGKLVDTRLIEMHDRFVNLALRDG
jgi:hypothetical protein